MKLRSFDWKCTVEEFVCLSRISSYVVILQYAAALKHLKLFCQNSYLHFIIKFFVSVLSVSLKIKYKFILFYHSLYYLNHLFKTRLLSVPWALNYWITILARELHKFINIRHSYLKFPLVSLLNKTVVVKEVDGDFTLDGFNFLIELENWHFPHCRWTIKHGFVIKINEWKNLICEQENFYSWLNCCWSLVSWRWFSVTCLIRVYHLGNKVEVFKKGSCRYE